MLDLWGVAPRLIVHRHATGQFWATSRGIHLLPGGQATQQGGPPPTVVVYTPVWLPVFALLFATFIGLVLGLYSALRAATLVPVLALKYE